MSYTPEDQKLQPGVTKILDGIRLTREAAMERLRDPDRWNGAHRDELEELLIDLHRFEFRLIRLADGTV